MAAIPSHPLLTLEAAKRFEDGLFGGSEEKEWPAMLAAGRAVGKAAVADFGEINRFPPQARLLVLAGKGHNGGDALLAAKTILGKFPDARADVWLVFGERDLRPLAARTYRELVQAVPGRVRLIARAESLAENYDLSLDGVFGFQFRPPLAPELAEVFARINALPIRFRAAIDLPSGLGDAHALRADFAYATGSVKTPLVAEENLPVVGRLRYCDLGFFAGNAPPATDRVLAPEILAPLRSLRSPQSDKRTYGHLFILGGSRNYPGAALMSVLAAVRSGAGLVTAFVPESLVGSFAARVPEAIWVGWPETPSGGLALEGLHLLRERLDRATALLLGSGAGREPETLALFADIAKLSPAPLVLDADALQPEIVRAGGAPRILTPHAGEFARISGALENNPVVTVRKAPLTHVSDGVARYFSCAGGPVLARGGSGDILAGLIGGLLAQSPAEPLAAACRGVAWQGRAADLLARAHGQTAVHTTQILDFLADALRDEGP